jgi:hypothetical protein
MQHIDEYLASLEESFGKPSTCIDVVSLREKYAQSGVSGILTILKLVVFRNRYPRIFFRIVSEQGLRNRGVDRCKTPYAWINIPEPSPRYVDGDFLRMSVHITIRELLLRRGSIEAIAFMLAHELCHALLNSFNHPLRRNEKVVDLLAMHCGCALLFESFALMVDATISPEYLTKEEGRYAVSKIGYR